MNSDVKKTKYSIVPNDVTIDPINNYYKKIESSIDDVIELYFKVFFIRNKNLIQRQKQLQDEIKANLKDIEDKKNQYKIGKLKFINGLIVFACFLIIGLFFLGVFSENKRVINDFENYSDLKMSVIENLKDDMYNLSLQFFSSISYSEIIQHLASQYDLAYENNCNKEIYQHFLSEPGFLQFKSCLLFKYKNTPIINTCTMHLEERDVVTSETRSYPYLATVSYVDDKGNMRTKTVTRYETLTAYHHEPTPFVIDLHKLYILTNFKPDLFFSTNNKPYLDFENNDFSKTFKIQTNRQTVDTDILQFFTIKAQEDFLNWQRYRKDNKVNFTKKGYCFEMDFNLKDIQENINNRFNLQYKIGEVDEVIDVTVNRIKSTVKAYFLELAQKSMIPLLSPAINREWYQSNGQYKILQSNNFEKDITPEDINFPYLISKVFKEENIYFIDQYAAKPPWATYVSHKQTADGFVEIEFNLNSYRSENLIDKVTVVGFHVGPKVIPVRYERFYEITTSKIMYFLPSQKQNKYIFSISSFIDNTFFDFDKNNEYSKNWVNDFKLWLTNPFLLFENKEQKFQRYKEILDEIRKNMCQEISIESVDVGFIIVVNTSKKEYWEEEHIKTSLLKIKNLLLELNNL